MKFFRVLFKIIITVLSVCGACYLFVELIERIDSDDSEDFAEGEESCGCLFDKVKAAAQKQFCRINSKD